MNYIIMYNNQLYNTNIFGAITPINTEQIIGNIVYNSYVLDKTDTVYATNADFYNTPDIEADIYSIPNNNGVWLNDYKYRQRRMTVEWTITAKTKVELQQKIDRMKTLLWEEEKTLQVIFNWEPRRATAYVNNLDFNQNHYNLTFIKYSVEFIIIDPFWQRVWQVTNTFSNITTTFQEDEVNRGWTFTDPVITLTFTSATDVDNIQLTMWDRGVEITQTISTNDIVRIDSVNQEVLINWMAVDFDWVLPRMKVGNNPYTVTVNGTYDYTLNIQHNLRFI